MAADVPVRDPVRALDGLPRVHPEPGARVLRPRPRHRGRRREGHQVHGRRRDERRGRHGARVRRLRPHADHRHEGDGDRARGGDPDRRDDRPGRPPARDDEAARANGTGTSRAGSSGCRTSSTSARSSRRRSTPPPSVAHESTRSPCRRPGRFHVCWPRRSRSSFSRVSGRGGRRRGRRRPSARDRRAATGSRAARNALEASLRTSCPDVQRTA